MAMLAKLGAQCIQGEHNFLKGFLGEYKYDFMSLSILLSHMWKFERLALKMSTVDR